MSTKVKQTPTRPHARTLFTHVTVYTFVFGHRRNHRRHHWTGGYLDLHWRALQSNSYAIELFAYKQKASAKEGLRQTVASTMADSLCVRVDFTVDSCAYARAIGNSRTGAGRRHHEQVDVAMMMMMRCCEKGREVGVVASIETHKQASTHAHMTFS